MIHKYCFDCGETVRLLVEVYVDANDINDDDSGIHAVAMELKRGEMEDQFGTGRNWPRPRPTIQGFCTQCQKVVSPVGRSSEVDKC